jgi:glycosyl hydrolase family 123
MKARKFLPAISGGRVVIMNRLLLLIVLCLAIPALSPAQGPLAPSYMPSIDTTCSHPQYAANVWMTDTMQKILQTNTTAATNACYITIYATQGEFADFQVHVVSPSGGYSALTFASSSFVQSSPGSFTIPAPSTSSNNIVVWREFYSTVSTNTTSGASAYYNTTGAYPDGLGPNIDPWFHQPTNAFPVSVAANNTQSAWVDIYVPNNAPAGFYLGSITVSNSGTTIATMPVILGVWQWPASQGGHMPATSSLPTDWGITSTAIYCDTLYNGDPTGCPGEGTTMAQMATMFLDHRVTTMDAPQQTVTGSAPLSYLMSGSVNPSYTTILSGAAFTGVPWQNEAYGAQAWDTLYHANTPTPWSGVVSYSYPGSCDEPTSSSMSSCISAGNTAHALSPPLPLMMTGIWCDGISGGSSCVSNVSGAANAVDYWVVEQAIEFRNNTDGGGSGTSELSYYTNWRATTNPDGIARQLWSYESCGSAGTCSNGSKGPSDFNFCNDNIDGRPVANRCMEWMTFMNGEQGELAFANVCTWPGNGGCAYSQSGTAQDPWVNAYAFGNNGSATDALPSTYNCSSSSSWAYPQQKCPYAEKIYVGTPSGASLATPLTLPTIRLKLKRDGFQDYEYLKALTNVGQGAYVTTQINSWITNRNSYEYTGTGLMAARLSLGTTLHQISYPTSLLPPPSLTGTVQ